MLAAVVALAAAGVPVGAAAEVTASVPLRWVEAPRPGEVVPGSSQTTIATADGTSMEVVTDGLIPGHTYTLWFTFFDHPENCLFPPNLPDTRLRCGLLDLFNPAADGNFVYGDGLVATGQDDVFRTFVATGVAPEGERQCDDGGTCSDEQVAFAWDDDDTAILTNPLGAEYQSTLRSHGPELDEYMPEQITTLNGGCHEGEPNHPCRDEQASGLRAQVPLECTEDPACLTSVHASEAAFLVGDGSGLVGEDRIAISMSARRLEGGGADGTFTFVHTDASGAVVAWLEGTIDCVRTAGTVGYTTGTITSSEPTAGGVNPHGQAIALTVADRGGSDVVTFNVPFETGIPIVEPCAAGAIPVPIDEGDYIVAH